MLTNLVGYFDTLAKIDHRDKQVNEYEKTETQ
jgi:hypothetical protein